MPRRGRRQRLSRTSPTPRMEPLSHRRRHGRMSLLARTRHPTRTWVPRPGAGAPASDRTRVLPHLVARARMPFRARARSRSLAPADIPDRVDGRSALPVRAGIPVRVPGRRRLPARVDSRARGRRHRPTEARRPVQGPSRSRLRARASVPVQLHGRSRLPARTRKPARHRGRSGPRYPGHNRRRQGRTRSPGHGRYRLLASAGSSGHGRNRPLASARTPLPGPGRDRPLRARTLRLPPARALRAARTPLPGRGRDRPLRARTLRLAPARTLGAARTPGLDRAGSPQSVQADNPHLARAGSRLSARARPPADGPPASTSPPHPGHLDKALLDKGCRGIGPPLAGDVSCHAAVPVLSRKAPVQLRKALARSRKALARSRASRALAQAFPAEFADLPRIGPGSRPPAFPRRRHRPGIRLRRAGVRPNPGAVRARPQGGDPGSPGGHPGRVPAAGAGPGRGFAAEEPTAVPPIPCPTSSDPATPRAAGPRCLGSPGRARGCRHPAGRRHPAERQGLSTAPDGPGPAGDCAAPRSVPGPGRRPGARRIRIGTRADGPDARSGSA
jgi:hypothetical protein